ncbi:hypothetical protein [Caballeronia sp. dw_276]|jgi:hypothetical protein|uniref:hypothetical protein n=1 Tax=Caballeronia sp. dw_276 TaxID=2719795 RepID=UPI001BD4FB91|nr:hypothetical protein [Caballeronia sp. dw_276]
MSVSSNLQEQQRRRIHSLIAATGIAVIVVSGIGVMTLTGAVPASKAVPVVTNVPPFIDTHIADPLSGLKPNAQPERGLVVGERTRASDAR